ncbi:MAG: hypothetical protein L7H21_00770 [Sulfolobales archaeon]|nr:hypothetical protein [Sulfolobales archaeon]MCG2894118.1 hypothetical protein [Sulfolobales archaeon]MCG2910172.1 hypothetical protein [Sulfolobales archaeon]
MKIDLSVLLTPSFHQSRVIEKDGSKFVVKCYEGLSGLKWFLIGPAFHFSYPFVASPEERMRRELDFLTSVSGKVNVPEVMDFDLEKKCLVRTFVEGERPRTAEEYRTVGEELSKIHSLGYVLGDAKPENFAVSEGKAYLIDAEQAIRSDDVRLRGWDLAVLFVFASYEVINNFRRFKEIVNAIKHGYSGIEGLARAIFDLRHASLLALMPPNYQFYLRNALLSD